MKYKVTTAAFDVTKTPPEPVKFTGTNAFGDGDFMGSEIVDTEETGSLFRRAKNVHDVEDMMLDFWNRLNPSSKEGPHFTHNPSAKVVVIDCRPYEEGE